MDIENLEEGKTYKNYKELCKALNMKLNSGNSKRYSLEKLKRYASISKNKQNITINKIYDEPLKVKNFERKMVYRMTSSRDLDNSVGIYSVTLDNKIYIGATMSGFRNRCSKHFSKNNLTNSRHITSDINTRFNIIELCDGMTKDEVIRLEGEYIRYYKNHSDYILLNSAKEGIGMTKSKENALNRKKCIHVKKSDFDKIVDILEKNKIDVFLRKRSSYVKITNTGSE